MTLLTLIRSLWIFVSVLLLIMPVIMFRRRLHRELPVFFGYLFFHAARSWVLLCIQDAGSYEAYAYSYWALEVLDAVLSFAVICELFSYVLRPYPSVSRIGILLFRWASGVLILIAAVSSAAAQGNDMTRLMAGTLVLERSVLVVECGLFLFVFMFAASLGLTWRHHIFGIALGFGLCAGINLVAVTVRAHFGGLDHSVFRVLKSGSYDCAVFIWMGYMLTSEKPVRLPQREPHHASELALWDNALTELLYNR